MIETKIIVIDELNKVLKQLNELNETYLSQFNEEPEIKVKKEITFLINDIKVSLSQMDYLYFENDK